jgi:hypothetical protein
MEQVACLICKKPSHNESNCPELVDPLKNGFYTGERGGDEEDDD